MTGYKLLQKEKRNSDNASNTKKSVLNKKLACSMQFVETVRYYFEAIAVFAIIGVVKQGFGQGV
jgi:hypothetical protein